MLENSREDKSLFNMTESCDSKGEGGNNEDGQEQARALRKVDRVPGGERVDVMSPCVIVFETTECIKTADRI